MRRYLSPLKTAQQQRARFATEAAIVEARAYLHETIAFLALLIFLTGLFASWPLLALYVAMIHG